MLTRWIIERNVGYKDESIKNLRMREVLRKYKPWDSSACPPAKWDENIMEERETNALGKREIKDNKESWWRN